MKNSIPRTRKSRPSGPLRHHIFGTDFQKRDDMTDDEALTRFDKVWSERIAPAIVIVGHYWHND